MPSPALSRHEDPARKRCCRRRATEIVGLRDRRRTEGKSAVNACRREQRWICRECSRSPYRLAPWSVRLMITNYGVIRPSKFGGGPRNDPTHGDWTESDDKCSRLVQEFATGRRSPAATGRELSSAPTSIHRKMEATTSGVGIAARCFAKDRTGRIWPSAAERRQAPRRRAEIHEQNILHPMFEVESNGPARRSCGTTRRQKDSGEIRGPRWIRRPARPRRREWPRVSRAMPFDGPAIRRAHGSSAARFGFAAAFVDPARKGR